MANGQKLIPANPGPQIAQRESDRQTMKQALRAVKSRAEGMAHKTAESEIRKSHPRLER